jgi:hypothetical protein
VALSNLTDGCQHFTVSRCHHSLFLSWKQEVSSEVRYLPTKIHSVTTHDPQS